jgi:hypothetical protein
LEEISFKNFNLSENNIIYVGQGTRVFCFAIIRWGDSNVQFFVSFAMCQLDCPFFLKTEIMEPSQNRMFYGEQRICIRLRYIRARRTTFAKAYGIK